MKKSFIFCIALLLIVLFGFGTPASALYYNDTTTKAGFDIDYTLTITPGIQDNTYVAAFNIHVNATPAGNTAWYIGAFDIKFFEGQGAQIPDLTPDGQTIDNVTWAVADSSQNSTASIGGWGRDDGKAGYFVWDLYENQNELGATKALPVVIGTDTTINFGIYGLGTLYTADMPFQVGYYGVKGVATTENYKFGQLSENFAVPEPATMFLLGAGLVGLAGFGRKRLINK